MICRRRNWLLLPVLLAAAFGQAFAEENRPPQGGATHKVWNSELAAEMASLFQQLPAPVIHEAGLTPAMAARNLRSAARYQELLGEKLQRKWFAALVTMDDSDPYSIVA